MLTRDALTAALDAWTAPTSYEMNDHEPSRAVFRAAIALMRESGDGIDDGKAQDLAVAAAPSYTDDRDTQRVGESFMGQWIRDDIANRDTHMSVWFVSSRNTSRLVARAIAAYYLAGN